jgi:hypothetical protein
LSWRSIRKRTKYDFRKLPGLSDSQPHRTIAKLKAIEVEPILRLLGTELDETLKQSLRKYLVILLISALEHFFKNAARLVIDNNNMDTSNLFEGKITFNVTDSDQLIKDEKLTKGRIVASTFNFMNLDETDAVFSNLLQMKFLHYVKMLNDIDQTKQIFDGHPIPLEYGRLKKVTI